MMMIPNPHQIAWHYIRPQLFGTVCEVVKQKPWGFKEDWPAIETVTVKEFLDQDKHYGTIILHILSGEGVRPLTIADVVLKARQDCIRLIVLEHDPEHEDWRTHNLRPLIFTSTYLPPYTFFNLGRNVLYVCDTFDLLALPLLSECYLDEALPKAFITAKDEGIDHRELIYTHTSESPIDFPIPPGRVWWVIGGGIAYESMQEDNYNILFDSILKQVLYAAKIYGEPLWKLKMLWPGIDSVQPVPDYKQWRVVKPNGVRPDCITHCDIQSLHCKDDTIYTSTINPRYWQHLYKDNNILEARSTRDKIKFLAPPDIREPK